MDSVRSASLAERRFTLLLVGAFGVVALLLAAVGVYGVVAMAVAERTAELGLRVALGVDAVSRCPAGRGRRPADHRGWPPRRSGRRRLRRRK